MTEKPIQIAVFASGTGSNALNLIDAFGAHPTLGVRLIVSNNPKAPIIESAASRGIPTWVLSPGECKTGEGVADKLGALDIRYIVLAGYLKLLPPAIIRAFEGRIANLHPALLPKFGGPGMYGARVHRAVKEAGESESGITLHVVTELYDEGPVIAQFKTAIEPECSAEDIEKKVRLLEKNHLPRAVEDWILACERNRI